MASASQASSNHIKIEDSPEPEILFAKTTSLPVKPPTPISPRDPENFMKRCSGVSKKTNLRCSAVIGKKSQKDTHPTFLPTCGAHRDQQSLAGWCQFKRSNGERCGRLFRWRPLYFELCDDHRGHPGTPCYFLKQLPLELRREVYRYLLPTESIGSSTATVHQETYENSYPVRRLVSRQIHDEVKDLLFSVVTFKIDVRKDGAFMCGRRLLEPKRADGSSHVMAEEADKAKKKFLRSFDWASVKNYTVDILLENWGNAYPHVNRALHTPWDEEVEIYDLRDYVSVVVSGILAKSKKLCKLQVRLGLDDFQWDEYNTLSNAKLLFNPFKRLRNVRQPSIGGVFDGRTNNNSIYSVIPGTSQIYSAPTGHYENCCSVPSLPTKKPILAAGIPAFDTYAAEWKRQISSESSAAITEEPPMRMMFAEFRNFYTELANYVPDITFRSGRHTFLHRARVAREQEDVIAFRSIRNELIHYWEAYKSNEERKKQEMNRRLGKLLESDMYPAHEWDDMSPASPQSPLSSGQPAQSPVLLDSVKMAQEGIPMTGNSDETGQYTSEQYIRMVRVQQVQRQSQQPSQPRVAHPQHVQGAHPTLSDYAHQHRQVMQRRAQLEAQQHAQQAQQQAQQQNQRLLRQTPGYQSIVEQSHACLAKLTSLKNQQSVMRQQANTAPLQQLYLQQAHSITLAVLDAQKKYDDIEREKKVLETEMETKTAVPCAKEREDGKADTTSEPTNQKEKSSSLGLMYETKDKENREEEEENSPDTLVNEDLYSNPCQDYPSQDEPGPLHTNKRRRIDSGYYDTAAEMGCGEWTAEAAAAGQSQSGAVHIEEEVEGVEQQQQRQGNGDWVWDGNSPIFGYVGKGKGRLDGW